MGPNFLKMLTSALVLNLWDLLSKSDGSAEAGGGGLGVAWKACGSKFLVVNKVDLLESLRRRGLEYSSFGALCEVLLQNNFCEDDLVPGQLLVVVSRRLSLKEKSPTITMGSFFCQPHSELSTFFVPLFKRFQSSDVTFPKFGCNVSKVRM